MKHFDETRYSSYLLVGDGWTMTCGNPLNAVKIANDGKGRINLYGIKKDGTKDRLD